MKKCLKKTLSGVLAAAMLFSSVSISNAFAAPSFSQVGGWFESIYAEIPSISDADVTGVSYSGTMSGTLSGDDFTYLVRDMSGGVRIDIPGLKAGTYTLTVTTKSGTITKDNIVVNNYDRSGYAHYNYTDGVGAYNDDGTLKANAKVLYVTNDNKNTVTVSSSDGTTVTGIGNILNSAGSKPKTDEKGNVLSTVINTNQDIIRKLAEDGTPLAVRFIGDVKAPEGLTAYDSYDYGGTVGDNGYMARMQNGKDITLEGIGNGAQINGWGFHFICQTAYPQFGKSFEARNLSFWGSPEDSLGMEGVQSGTTITASVERCWVHNCSFFPQKIANPAESDKSEGDGCCDFKRGQYMTMSYCYYKSAHKTSLIGSSDSSLQYHVTWHHNMWENCEARGPLTRNANVHIYNCYYKQQSDYCINPRANSYVFAEYNLFENCKNPVSVVSGAVKSYNNSFSGCINANDSTVVTDKSTKVNTSNKYANFDTDSSVSYIPSGDYKLTESVSQAKKEILAYTGVMKDTVVTPDEVNASILASDRQPTASVKLPYDKDLNSSYVTSKSATIDNVIFNINKSDATMVSTNTDSIGQTIVFNVNQPVNISMTDGGGTYPVVLTNEYGEEFITGTGSATNVPAGTYIIQSSGFQPAKGTTPLKYKEAKISHLTIVSAGSELPTVAEPTTSEPTTADPSKPTEVTTSNTEEPDTEETTSKPYTGDGLVWNYTSGDNTLGVNFDGNDYTGSSVSYNGSTFTKGAKMESSTNIGFTAPGAGKLTIVTYSTKNPATVKVNGETVTVSQNGATTIDVPAGAVSITKGTTGTYVYLLEFTGDSTETTTTVVTEETTQATTSEATTKSDAATETTTTAPEGVVVSAGSTTAKTGDTITVPVKLTGLTTLENYAVTIKYDSNVLTLGDVVSFRDSDNFIVNKNTAGVINVVYANDNAGTDDSFNGDVLFNMTFTVKAESNTTSPITVTVNDLNDGVTATVVNGTVTVDNTVTPVSIPGDVNKDGVVNSVDAAIVLKIASGVITDTTPYDMTAADCDGKAGVTVLDAVWILNHQTGEDNTTTTTTEATTEATTAKVEDTTKATEATTKADATTETTTTAPVSGGLAAGSYNLAKGVTVEGIDTSTAYGSDTTAIKVRVGKGIKVTPAVSGTLSITWSNKAPKILVGTTDVTPSDTTSPCKVTVTAGTVYTIEGSTDSNTNISNVTLSSNGTVVEPTTQATTKSNVETTTTKTETTTKKTDSATETTTSGASTSNGSGKDLTTPPSNTIATITSNSETALTSAIKTMKSSGGTIYINTPKISLSTALKLEGTANGAIVGVQQSDGTYPVLDFSGLRDSGSSSRGLTIASTASNKLIQNIIVEKSGDNGIYINGKNNTIEHVIARYNGDTGIQLSGETATGNVLRYCYAYRNCDVKTNGANADGFAPKLGASDTTFEYCYSWDNSDDGWDSFDKEGDNGAKVVYKHSACWNNGNPQVFTGEYDYNKGNALDTNLWTVEQMIASDSSFASNYANKKFSTANAKINGSTVAAWLTKANTEMNGNGFKFGSKLTAQNEGVTRTADYCVAFDHKSKGFDNNNSQGCSGYISNCVSFQNNINFQLPYVFKLWTNNYSWGAITSETAKQDVTPTIVTDTTTATNKFYAVRDKIVDAVYANKFPDGVTFDSTIDSLK